MHSAKFQTFQDAVAPVPVRERVDALRASLRAHGLDAFLVPHADAFQGEYQPASEARLAWLTGFTGSAGFAAVLHDKAALFVDGRYTLQATRQTDGDVFTIMPSHERPVANWLAAQNVQRVGYDPRLMTVRELEAFAKALARRQAQFVPLDVNPIDALWGDRPMAPATPIETHPLAFSGRAAAEKIADVQTRLAEDGVDALFLGRTPGIAWLFNIRARDVAHLPIARCFALIPRTGRAIIFADPGRVNDAARADLADVAEFCAEEHLLTKLKERIAGARVRLAAGDSSPWMQALVEQAAGNVDLGLDPTELAQAVKNEVEIAGARAAHLRDGAAMVRFLAWFDQQATSGTLTEIDAAVALEDFRRATGELCDIAFDTIAGAGSNGAIVHYRVNATSNRRIEPGLFLIDSGGQYRDGTTDITRTIAVGPPELEMSRRFTLVLKGLIALSRAIFPKGTSGAQLDAFARQFLWTEGLDYDHGTGHGVGSFLSVHEGPQRFSKLGTEPLQAGMILSNEPGYYKTGAYGIRIENLVLVKTAHIEGAERPMLALATLTLAPIDRRLIDTMLLSAAEHAWIDTYHASVAASLGPLLDDETRRWLADATAPLSGARA